MSLLHPDARLVDAVTGDVLGGAALTAEVAAVTAALAGLTPGVVFARMSTDAAAVTRYLGTWDAARPVALLDPALPGRTLADLVDRFAPAVVLGLDARPAVGEAEKAVAEAPEGYREIGHPVLGRLWERETPPEFPPHPDLGVLLATSGSTGDPKLVRLSRSAVLANTAAIVDALGITGAEVAASTLPFFYSFGMSVLNSHLSAGATVLLESGGLTARPFWTAVNAYGVTSLACVPYQYEMLRRLRFDPAKYPTLRTLTQAGGRLRPELVADFHQRMAAVGGRLFVMYGQTEAAPRLTTLPAGRLADKIGSVGPAVPGGALSVRLEDGSETTEPGVTGEIWYRGPNVMLGYAETAADLALGDEQGGVLRTGDLGRLDEDGYLYISGRLKRFGKVFGVRLNLDDIEAMLRDRGPAAVVSGDDKVVVWLEGADEETARGTATDLAERLNLHWSGFDIRATDALPLLPNGKIDYRTLEAAS
ncbi:AMP-dependent acyl-CoA synthetase [Longispora fulva]|uniref:Acyl-CoA synthetase (AMP-forming)/AMP-acid ligase II n=2 Tax=Longispora fulva TaxID=619741 RepID=A0A8J7H428_9ACTN|nr:acyl-CoA synthetase (AMP-forming)/AMP-acid ligase II [Longispora fulva]GIG60766.1 AMP-dependent acyl-CoA synthetase [Longispora fulva]